jgi:hypothetical protein
MNRASLALVGWLAAAVVVQGSTAAQDGSAPTPSRCAALLQQADPTVQILTSTSVAEGPLPGAGISGAAAARFPAHCVATGIARLFLVPGMTHCSGGRSLDDFDPLTALVQWVEEGHPPERMIAQGSAFPGRTRPLCAYPQQARYRGQGSTEVAENFECREPDEGRTPR